MLSLGPMELIIIGVILVIFFGAGKLGDVGGALGKTFRDLRDTAGWNEADKPNDPKPIDKPKA